MLASSMGMRRMSWMCSLISLEMHETSSPPELSAREEEALKRTAKCLEGCRIADVSHTSQCTPAFPHLLRAEHATWAMHTARQSSQCPVQAAADGIQSC